MIHQVIKGARNLQRESYAGFAQSSKVKIASFEFSGNLDDFFACHGCKLGRHFSQVAPR